jgi:hypothetical protein
MNLTTVFEPVQLAVWTKKQQTQRNVSMHPGRAAGCPVKLESDLNTGCPRLASLTQHYVFSAEFGLLHFTQSDASVLLCPPCLLAQVVPHDKELSKEAFTKAVFMSYGKPADDAPLAEVHPMLTTIPKPYQLQVAPVAALPPLPPWRSRRARSTHLHYLAAGCALDDAPGDRGSERPGLPAPPLLLGAAGHAARPGLLRQPLAPPRCLAALLPGCLRDQMRRAPV